MSLSHCAFFVWNHQVMCHSENVDIFLPTLDSAISESQLIRQYRWNSQTLMENKAVQCKFISPSSKKERKKETMILYSFLSPPPPGFWSAFSRKPLDTSLAPRDQSVHLFSTAMWGVGVGVGHVVSESIYFDARGCWDTTFANSYYSGTPVVYSQINTKITVWKRSNPPPVPTPVSPLTCDMPKLMLPDSFPTYIFFLSRGFETVNIPYPTLKTLVSSL